MAEPIRRLPDAELEVMQALWACGGPATRVVCISCAPATLGYMAQWAEAVDLFPGRRILRRWSYFPNKIKEVYYGA